MLMLVNYGFELLKCFLCLDIKRFRGFWEAYNTPNSESSKQEQGFELKSMYVLCSEIKGRRVGR